MNKFVKFLKHTWMFLVGSATLVCTVPVVIGLLNKQETPKVEIPSAAPETPDGKNDSGAGLGSEKPFDVKPDKNATQKATESNTPDEEQVETENLQENRDLPTPADSIKAEEQELRENFEEKHPELGKRMEAKRKRFEEMENESN
jgi:hypothetical protein